jgi:transcriptional regulator with XRE-family HTH domain
MRSKVAERILARTPEDVKIFTRLYADLVVRINSILKEKGITQKSLAESLDKRPSEINKWLSGDHNFTLRSIAKLQAELGKPLIEVPASKPKAQHYQKYSKAACSFTVYKNVSVQPDKPTADKWTNVSPQPDVIGK